MVRRLIGGVGRTLITAGVLLLLFVGYQLWGTGIATAREQDRLESAVDAQLASQGIDLPAIPADLAAGREPSPTTSTTPRMAPVTAAVDTTVATTGTDDTDPSTVESPTVAAAPTTTGPELTSRIRTRAVPLKDGEAIGQMVIPRISLKKYLVEGTSVEALRKGPGHYAGTPLPGEPGNAAIAGHRTTYGGPFFRMDEMRPGDPIFVFSLKSRQWFRYDVTGTRIVKPSQSEVLQPTEGMNTLTLTTCHPRYSASQRMVVTARLVGAAVEADTEAVPQDPFATTVPASTVAPVPTATLPPTAAPTTPTTAPDPGATTTVAPPTTVAPTTTTTAGTDDTGTTPGVPLSLDSRRTGRQIGFSWLSGPRVLWAHTVIWAAVCALIWLATWLGVRSRRRVMVRGAGYAVVFAVAFLPALYFCFENLARLLPENV